jgi:hypothetical protein
MAEDSAVIRASFELVADEALLIRLGSRAVRISMRSSE